MKLAEYMAILTDTLSLWRRNDFIDTSELIRYNGYAVDSFQQEGGDHMEFLTTFLLSVAASVAWLLHMQMARQKAQRQLA